MTEHHVDLDVAGVAGGKRCKVTKQERRRCGSKETKQQMFRRQKASRAIAQHNLRNPVPLRARSALRNLR